MFISVSWMFLSVKYLSIFENYLTIIKVSNIPRSDLTTEGPK